MKLTDTLLLVASLLGFVFFAADMVTWPVQHELPGVSGLHEARPLRAPRL